MKRLLSVVLVAIVLLAVGAIPAFAQDGRVVVGGSVSVTADNPVRGDLLVLGGSVSIDPDGVVEGDVAIIGGSVSCRGTIEGSVFILGGNLSLGPDAVVYGDLTEVGGSVSRSPGAVVRGRVQRGWSGNFPNISLNTGIRNWDWGAGFAGGWFFSVVFALLAAILLPKNVQRTRESFMASPWASLGVGFLAGVVAVIVGALLIITICLSPIGALVLLAAWVVGMLGLAGIGLELGERMLRAFGAKSFAQPWAVLLGAFTLVIVSYIPCIGWLFGLAVVSASLGAAILSQFGTKVYGPSRPAPTA